MNKLHVTGSLVLIGIVLAIFVALQKDSFTGGVGPSPIPTLAPDNLFAPQNNSQQQQASAQEQQAAAQAQQQAQQPQPTMGVEEPIPATATAHIKTSKGTIDLKLFGDKAPKTVKNFISKAKAGFYTNLSFHRVEDWVIQGGDPKGDGSGGGQMATEINDTQFVRGSLGVARGTTVEISNDAQFFITKLDSPHLNNQYTNFGMVTNGLSIVDKITQGDKILQITIENK